MDRVLIFDTTLRDGEQSPGASLHVEEKVEIAHQLARLGVDVIEAGFPVASPGDFEAVRRIAREVRTTKICALARAVPADIDRAWEALREAESPRIHTFISASDIHLKHQLRKTREEVLEITDAMVRRAKSYVSDVEFSPMDATRADPEYLFRMLEVAIAAGATTVNIPDTVGYATPDEFAELIRQILQRVRGIEKVVLSVHCHNDLGLATANSLAAILAGARQVECTINGIGERAGNAALEEIIMALHTRANYYQATTNIVTQEITRTSRLVSHLTGFVVPPNKAVVGENAFAHEAGIHQDGMLKERTTYEIMTPQSVGLTESRLVLGKHSGRHAFAHRLAEMGYSLAPEELEAAYQRFIELADRKKHVTDRDLRALVEQGMAAIPETLRLDYVHVTTGNTTVPTATVRIRQGERQRVGTAHGDGPVEAVYRAIDQALGVQVELESYALQAVTGGKDALGEVTVRIRNNGRQYVGRAASTDIIEASARAYLHGVNKMLYDQSEGGDEAPGGSPAARWAAGGEIPS